MEGGLTTKELKKKHSFRLRHNAATWLLQAGEYLRLHHLQHNRCAETKIMAQMKEQIKTPKIELSHEEIANLSDAEFKTLVIRMLTEMVEYGHKIEEKVKAMQSEIKKNIQGTNSEGKETGTQINDLEQKKEINNQNTMKQEFSPGWCGSVD